MDLNQLTKQWSATGLLEPYKGEEAISLATCLEAQKKLNESIDSLDHPKFKRLTIPLVRRIFGESKAVERNHFINYFENNGYNNSYVFKIKFPGSFGNTLDEEAENTAQFASKMAKEIDLLFSDQLNSKISFNGFDIMEDNSIVMYFN